MKNAYCDRDTKTVRLLEKHESFKLQTICDKIITLLIFEIVLYKSIILLLQNQQHIIFHSVFVSNCEQCFLAVS